MTHVCPCAPTRVHLIKSDRRQCASPFGWTVQLVPPYACWTGASAPVPSAGLSSRYPPYACCLREQVPGVPRCTTSPNPESRKKIARLAHLASHSFGGRGAQSFPSPRRWMPRIRNDMRRIICTCLPGKPDPCTPITT